MSGIATPVIIVVIIGLVAALLLVIASKVFYVHVDERITEVRELLPGANCGGCGFAGCDDYAKAVVEDNVSCSLCTVGGASTAEAVADLMGKAASTDDPEVAQVFCNGTNDASRKILEWQGMASCTGAKSFFNGNNACSYGCIGLGDCVRVCQFDSIGVIDGVARVDRDKCVACGACVKECPQKIISLVPKKSQVFVVCMSKDKGADTRKACSNGCIACGLCVKECKFDAIRVEDNKAVIDTEKCKNCGMCMRVCPTGAINSYNFAHVKAALAAKEKAAKEKAEKAAAAVKAKEASAEAN